MSLEYLAALLDGPTAHDVGADGGAAIALAVAALEAPPALDLCACGETLYRDRCYNVGACRHAERSSVRGSLVRGTAASAAPAAWTLGGRVD